MIKLVNIEIPKNLLDDNYVKLIEQVIIASIYLLFLSVVYNSMDIKSINVKEVIFFTYIILLFHNLVGKYLIRITSN